MRKEDAEESVYVLGRETESDLNVIRVVYIWGYKIEVIYAYLLAEH